MQQHVSLKYSATQELTGNADSCFLIAMHDKAYWIHSICSSFF